MHISKQLIVKNKLEAKSFFPTSEMKLIKFLNIFTTWNSIRTTLFVHGSPNTGSKVKQKGWGEKKWTANLKVASRVVKTRPRIRIQRYFLYLKR